MTNPNIACNRMTQIMNLHISFPPRVIDHKKNTIITALQSISYIRLSLFKAFNHKDEVLLLRHYRHYHYSNGKYRLLYNLGKI